MVFVGLALLLAAACATVESPPPTVATGEARQLVVFAAASLTSPFSEIGRIFEAEHSGTTVIFNFSGSSALAAQLAEGAPADVFASADEATMAKLVAKGAIDGSPTEFATNELAIVVAPGNPKAIGSLVDLARASLLVVLAAPQVPAGRYAALALDRAGVRLTPVSWENDVKAVAAKVASGEADAGIVYRSDVTGANPRTEGVAIPSAFNVTAHYPIAVTKASIAPNMARAFVAMVSGPKGQAVLARAGFGPP